MLGISNVGIGRLWRVIAGFCAISMLATASAPGQDEPPGDEPPPPDNGQTTFVGIGGNPPTEFEGAIFDEAALEGVATIFLDEDEGLEGSHVPVRIDLSGDPWTKTITVDISEFGIQSGALLSLWEDVVIRPPESPGDLLPIRGWRQFIPDGQDWHFDDGTADEFQSDIRLDGLNAFTEEEFAATTIEFRDGRLIDDGLDLRFGSINYFFDDQTVTEDGVFLWIDSLLVYTGDTIAPSPDATLSLTIEQMVAIPEPGAYAFMVGLLTLFAARWRRRMRGR